jgi:hypothetical protein
VTTIGAVIRRRSDVVALASVASLLICCAIVAPLVWLAGVEGGAAAVAIAAIAGAWLPIPLSRRLFSVPFTLRPLLPFLLISAAVAFGASHAAVAGSRLQAAVSVVLIVAYTAGSALWARHAGFLPGPRGTVTGLRRPALSTEAD